MKPKTDQKKLQFKGSEFRMGDNGTQEADTTSTATKTKAKTKLRYNKDNTFNPNKKSQSFTPPAFKPANSFTPRKIRL